MYDLHDVQLEAIPIGSEGHVLFRLSVLQPRQAIAKAEEFRLKKGGGGRGYSLTVLYIAEGVRLNGKEGQGEPPTVCVCVCLCVCVCVCKCVCVCVCVCTCVHVHVYVCG